MNDLMDMLKTCKTDEEIKEIVDYYIGEYVEESLPLNHGRTTLGKQININPEHSINENLDYGPKTNNRWVGYIPKETKIVYKCVNHEGLGSNDGGYYYMGDESYLYDFCKFIKNKEFNNNPIVFILHVNKFIHQYLDNDLMQVDREIIHTLIESVDGRKLGPVREHYLSDFKGMGAAKCSEYAVMAQNIMTIFGLETDIVFDSNHAYNIFFEENGDANVLDFSNRIAMYDVYLNMKEKMPFMEPIADYSDDLYEEVLYEGRKIRFDNYSVVDFPNSSLICTDDLIRVYGADGKMVLRDSTAKSLIIKK